MVPRMIGRGQGAPLRPRMLLRWMRLQRALLLLAWALWRRNCDYGLAVRATTRAQDLMSLGRRGVGAGGGDGGVRGPASVAAAVPIVQAKNTAAWTKMLQNATLIAHLRTELQ